MRHRLGGRAAVAAVALVGLLASCKAREEVERAGAAARAGTGKDTAQPVADSAKVGAKVGQVVAAMLSNENIFALLDTTYAATLELDTLAQTRASDPRLRDFATREIPQHNLARRGAVDERDRLKITAALPDPDPIKGHADAMRALRAKSGKAFDEGLLDHFIEMQQGLLDKVDQALTGRTTPEVRTFLRQIRANIEADVKGAKDLREKV